MDKDMKLVDFASVELLAAHYVRIIKWLVAAVIIAVCLLFASNAIWLATDVEVQEVQEIEATQAGDGSFVIGGGDVSYGETSSTD